MAANTQPLPFTRNVKSVKTYYKQIVYESLQWTSTVTVALC